MVLCLLVPFAYCVVQCCCCGHAKTSRGRALGPHNLGSKGGELPNATFSVLGWVSSKIFSFPFFLRQTGQKSERERKRNSLESFRRSDQARLRWAQNACWHAPGEREKEIFFPCRALFSSVVLVSLGDFSFKPIKRYAGSSENTP